MVFTFSFCAALYAVHHINITPSPNKGQRIIILLGTDIYTGILDQAKYSINSRLKMKLAISKLLTISFLIEAKLMILADISDLFNVVPEPFFVIC